MDEEATSFAGESSMEKDEEEEKEDDSWTEGSRLRKGFTKSEEAKDMVNGNRLVRGKVVSGRSLKKVKV